MANESTWRTTLRNAVANLTKFTLGERATLRNIVWRVFKAVLYGSLTYLVGYYLPNTYLTMEALPPQLAPPPQVGQMISGVQSWVSSFLQSFTIIITVFTVAIQLLTGTILQYAFSFARGFTVMMFIIYAFQGGVIETTIPAEGVTIFVKMDFKVFLAMFVAVSLLGMARSMLGVINFLSESEAPIEE